MMRPQSGFSLLELIVVVVLLGVLAGIGGLLVANPLEAFDDQRRRQQLVDQGEMALRQIASDVRRALPNSVRVTPVGSGHALELVRTLDGARYRDQNEDAVPLAGPDEILEFDSGDTFFNLLGSFSSLSAFGADDRIVIYNTSPGTLYDDAENDTNPGIITPSGATLSLSASTIYAGEQQIQVDNGATDFQFAQQSPGQRLFVVEEPVSYICNPVTGRLQRHDSYGFNATQSTAPGGNTVIVMAQLLGCNMSYTTGTSERGGILTIRIIVGESASETVSLLHQVHVENVP